MRLERSLARKGKKSTPLLIHLLRDREILLVLGSDDRRIKDLEKRGFVVQGFYRLSRTGGNLAISLPETGVFACASSPLAQSPWLKSSANREGEK